MIIHFRVSPFGATFGCKPCWELNFQDFHGPHMKTKQNTDMGFVLLSSFSPYLHNLSTKCLWFGGQKIPQKNNFQTHPYKVNRSPKLRTWFQHCRKKMVKSFVLDSLDFNQVTPMWRRATFVGFYHAKGRPKKPPSLGFPTLPSRLQFATVPQTMETPIIPFSIND